MKKIIIALLTLTSLSSFAGDDKLEIVRIKASSAQSAYSQAVDMVEEINDARWSTKLPYLRVCNPTAGDFNDGNFQRKAYTSTSFVSVDHVTGMYTALVKVRCED